MLFNNQFEHKRENKKKKPQTVSIRLKNFWYSRSNHLPNEKIENRKKWCGFMEQPIKLTRTRLYCAQNEGKCGCTKNLCWIGLAAHVALCFPIKHFIYLFFLNIYLHICRCLHFTPFHSVRFSRSGNCFAYLHSSFLCARLK